MNAVKLKPEDLKSRKIFCQLNLARVNKVNEEREHIGFAKVTFGGPQWPEQRTFALAFVLATEQMKATSPSGEED